MAKLSVRNADAATGFILTTRAGEEWITFEELVLFIDQANLVLGRILAEEERNVLNEADADLVEYHGGNPNAVYP